MSNTKYDKFAQYLNFKVEKESEDCATISAEPNGDCLNGVGIVHGGWLFSLADYASAVASNTDDIAAISSHSIINFLTPAKEGKKLIAEAKVSAKTPKTAVVDVVISEVESGEIRATMQARVVYKQLKK